MKLCTAILNVGAPLADLKYLGMIKVKYYELDTNLDGEEVLTHENIIDYVGVSNGYIYRITLNEWRMAELLSLEVYQMRFEKTDLQGKFINKNLDGVQSIYNSDNMLCRIGACKSIMSYIYYLNSIDMYGKMFKLDGDILEVITYTRLYKFRISDVGAFTRLLWLK